MPEFVDRKRSVRREQLAARARLGVAGRASPGLLRFVRRVLGPFVRVAFRPRLEGWERFPSDRPFLVVANHSGGGAADIMCLTALWFGRFGGERPITGMANPGGFFVPGV